MCTVDDRDERGGLLVAVLLNPPASSPGTRTRNAVGRAARVLDYDAVEIVNLCTTATASVVELNGFRDGSGWLLARAGLQESLRRAAGVLAAWGVAGMTGETQRARDEQIAWLNHEVAAAGLSHVWMVGGQPRHPSRWHQYVSDKYGRTTGGPFDERLAQVIRAVPVLTG